MENVNRIVAEGIAAVEAAQDFNALEQIKARYLGKTGELTGLLKTLGQMSPEERKTIGAHINECKNQFQTAFVLSVLQIEINISAVIPLQAY